MNRYIIVLMLYILSMPSVARAQISRQTYGDFKKVKVRKTVSRKKLTWFIGADDETNIQLNLSMSEIGKITVFLNDSLCSTDSIKNLDNADYDLYMRLLVPNPKKKQTIYVYIHSSKRLLEIPYKSKYYFISVYDQGDSCIVIYTNNAPLM